MTGVTFYRCNLDNVYIPEGNTVHESCGTPRLIKIQNDLRDWELDKNTLEPVKVCNEDRWKQEGYSVEKIDLPIQKLNDIKEVKRKIYAETDTDIVIE